MARKLGIMIRSPHCLLPELSNDYFYIDSEWEEDIMNGTESKRTQRFFGLKGHDDERLIGLLGEQGTFIFHRIMLSYYDAFFMIQTFMDKYYANIREEKLKFEDILEQSKTYDINLFNSYSVDELTTLCLHDVYGEERTYYFREHKANEVQEMLFSMNLKTILTNHKVSYFKNRTFQTEDLKSSNSNLVVYKMLINREISMVMHTWRKLNSYNNGDFISNISSILEFITKDLKQNSDKFNKESNHYSKLKNLLEEVNENSKSKKYFFGIFNDAENLGFLSRHGKVLLDFKSFNVREGRTIYEIITEMKEDRCIPNENELNYLFNIWHYTTSLIVLLWSTIRKSE
ncbi:hypothetical protein [Sutcliffiella cohnii]|uniref:hypothetical protein n=1 Tax=Sutcliffiella cohnii TaxID=33932 RepID=UPI002E1D44E3|nr:hypothetical protein [Sutcliffiella cohnii]